MILVDTSVWISHLRAGELRLSELLNAGRVLGHPFVIGEVALGNLRRRESVLEALRGLPQAILASDDETQHFIESRRLFGLGIGYVDATLLASVTLTPDGSLWTHDKRLHEVATGLSLTFG